MSRVNVWQTGLTLATLFSVNALFFLSPGNVAPALSQDKEEAAETTTENCRQVESPRGLIVRKEPSRSAARVAGLNDGVNVTIENRGAKGWVPISAPFQGYVSSEYLIQCPSSTATTNTVVVPPTSARPLASNCRRVLADGGLYVRQSPTNTAPIMGLFANRQEITIVNRGTNGWVPVENPIKGFVSVEYLGECVF